jgi:Ca2+-binding RTX toxin-like protein
VKVAGKKFADAAGNDNKEAASTTLSVRTVASQATSGNDLWRGTQAADTFDGLGGNDSLAGEAGNDTLASSAGENSLDGGEGNDALTRGPGNESLQGGAGDDTLVGAPVTILCRVAQAMPPQSLTVLMPTTASRRSTGARAVRAQATGSMQTREQPAATRFRTMWSSYYSPTDATPLKGANPPRPH